MCGILDCARPLYHPSAWPSPGLPYLVPIALIQRSIQDHIAHTQPKPTMASPPSGSAAAPFGGTLPGDASALEMVNVKKLLQSRSLEIEELFTALKRGEKQDRVFQRLPFALRRRAMSHNPFRVPKRLRLHLAREMAKNMPKCAKRLRKDARRRLNRLEEYRTRCERNNWLETHLYHAKRFKMATLWGYRVALRTTQKCRRRCLRYSQRRAVVHDLSYMRAVAVSGPLTSLRRALSSVFADSSLMFQDHVMDGRYRSQAIAYATTGENRRLICPVYYLWISPQGSGNPPHNMDTTREIWFFVHPAAIAEFSDTIGSTASDLDCRMVNDLCTFEIMGPLSALLLRGTLKVDGNVSAGNALWKRLSPENIEMPPSYVLPLRVTPPNVYGNLRPAFKLEVTRRQHFSSNSFVDHAVSAGERRALCDFRKPDDFSIVTKVNVPRLRRPNYAQLVSKLLGTLNVTYPSSRNSAPQTGYGSRPTEADNSVDASHTGESPKSHTAASSHHVSGDRNGVAVSDTVPIWLIRRGDAIGGFDLIMPAGTIARKLWILLNRYGALGIGLHEREMLYAQHAQCMFPQDYPEALAGQLHRRELEAEMIRKYLSTPASKRPNYGLMGVDRPFNLPVFDTSQDATPCFLPDLPGEWLPRAYVGRVEGGYLSSRHLLLSAVTAGLQRASTAQSALQVLRISSFPFGASIGYLNELLDDHLSSVSLSNVAPVHPSLLLSCSIEVAGRGSLSRGDRIYLPSETDLDANASFVTAVIFRTSDDHTSRWIAPGGPRLAPPQPSSLDRSATTVPGALVEPAHEEYKLGNLKRVFGCTGRSKRVSPVDAANGLRELEARKRPPLRRCFGAVTSQGFAHKGNCVVQLSGYLELLRSSIVATRFGSDMAPPRWRKMGPPALIAICCDEDAMCSRLHNDGGGRFHPENPGRLRAILKRLMQATLRVDGHGEHPVLDFTRRYECRAAEFETLRYCHSERHVRNLMGYCQDVARMDVQRAAEGGDGKEGGVCCASYPVDEDTYVTGASERVARLAVGGIVKLADVLMGKSDAHPVPSPVSPPFDGPTVAGNHVEGHASDDGSDVRLSGPQDASTTDLNGHINDDTKQTISGEVPEASVASDGSSATDQGTVLPSTSEQPQQGSIDNVIDQMQSLTLSKSKRAPRKPGIFRKGFALIRPPGHHATKDQMLGFCLYNNVAIAAAHLQRNYGLKRIAIVDFDVHHGNGTQDIFYDDPGVCVISIHRFGTGNHPFYPYSGNYHEIGGPNAMECTVNIPLSAGYTSHDMVYAFREVVLPKLELFRPEFILVSCGLDAAQDDLLGGCGVTPDCYGWMTQELCILAERFCEGRVLLSLEGGYNYVVNANCVEAIFRTLIAFENDSSLRTPFNYDATKVKSSTRTVCTRLKGLVMNRGGAASDTAPSPTLSRDPPALPLSTGAGSAGGTHASNLRWEHYDDPVDDNSFVIAAGHLNQFVVPINPVCSELCKLCARREVAFYQWLYGINGIELEVVDRECPYLRLPFSKNEEEVRISGMRFVADLVRPSTVRRSASQAEAPQTPTELDGGVDVVKQLIDFVVECTGIYTSRVFSRWDLERSHTNAVRLRNALHGMRQPCVMDLKMGTRLHGDDLTDPKQILEKQLKAEERSCKTHGFHMSGLFCWDRVNKRVAYLHDRVIRTIKDSATLVTAFTLFFGKIRDAALSCRVIDKFMARLKQLLSLFERQTQLAFYGSSLLFVYDAGATTADHLLASANFYVIDLSHVSFNTKCLDEGYLLGLRTIISLLTETGVRFSGQSP
ncbi:ribonucleases domain containing protein [Babesia caballi]|uniref:Ribonucleases domain containing protein n=1 Tax=Babesia caballi TaxID=5871 RepID=A0AAV4LQD4_BABCB|nr:ribonucleases domain containing protein [Babesia caballi]